MKFNKLLKETQFHGGRRLAGKTCRWLWSITMLWLFISSVAVVFATVRRFLVNPTFMVRMEQLDTHMEFPSVLVCPEVFFRDDKIDRFLSHVNTPPSLNVSYLKQRMGSLAAFFSPDVMYKTTDLVNLEYLLEYNNMDVTTAGRLLTSSCGSTLLKCRWQSEYMKCSKLFRMELTGDGFCCVFNGRSLNDDRHTHRSRRTWYAEGFGMGSGLTVVVNQSIMSLYGVDLFYKWLAIQSSQHYIESSVNGTPLSPGSEQWVQYHIQSFQIASEAKTLRHSLRKCRTADEHLKFYPLYHKKYCLVECEVARTIKQCNCVRRVHPRPPGVTYCDATKLLCAQHAMVSSDSDECSCPPACDVATDYTKIQSFELIPGLDPIDTIYDGLNFSKVTVVRVFLPTQKVEINARWSYFSKIDLFSQLGGVFNMFFGCSILTLLELLILGINGVRGLAPKKSILKLVDPKKHKQKKRRNGSKKKKIRFAN